MKEILVEQIINDFKSDPFFNLEDYDIEFKDVAIPLLMMLLEDSVYNKEQVSLGTVEDNTSKDRNVIVLPYDSFNSDLILEFKLRNKNIFEMQLEYYLSSGDEDGWRRFVYKLTKEELKLVPANVLKTMRKVQKEIYGSYSREFDNLYKLEVLHKSMKAEKGIFEDEGITRETFQVKLL